MQIAGTEQFAASADRVREALSDLDILARSIPGLNSVERNDGTTLECRIKPSLSFISGALRTTVTRTSEAASDEAGDEVAYSISSKGIGGGATVTATFRCSADRGGGGSSVEWRAEVVERTGLLKPVGDSVIESTMGSVVESTWERFRSQLVA